MTAPLITLSNILSQSTAASNIAISALNKATNTYWYLNSSNQYTLSNVVIGASSTPGNYALHVVGNINYTGILHNNGTPVSTAIFTIDATDNSNINNTSNMHILSNNPTGATPQAQWATSVTSAQGSHCTGNAIDNEGNVYMCGYTLGTGTHTVSSSNTSSPNTAVLGNTQVAYLVKYNRSGIFQWASRVEGTTLRAWDVCCDTSTNTVYLVGNHGSTTATVYNSSGQAAGVLSGQYPATSALGTGYLIKYTSSGAVSWFAYITNVTFRSVDVDKVSGYVFVAGDFAYNGTNSTLPQLYNRNNVHTGVYIDHNANGSSNNQAFVAAYTSSGMYQFYTHVLHATRGNAVHVDRFQNFYLTGRSSNISFVVHSAVGLLPQPTSNVYTTTTEACYLAKWDFTGALKWCARVDSTTTETGFDVVSDTSGNVYMGFIHGSGVTPAIINANGTTHDTLRASTLGDTAAVVEYNSNGVAQWFSAVDAQCTTDSNEKVLSLAVDPTNGLWMSSRYQGTNRSNVYVNNTFATNPTMFLPSSPNSFGTFLLYYNSTGKPTWCTGVDSTAQDRCASLACDATGAVFYAGSYAVNTASATTLTVFNPVNNSVPVSTSAAIVPSSSIANSVIVKYNLGTFPLYRLAANLGTINNGLIKTLVNSSASAALVNLTSSNNATILSSASVEPYNSKRFLWFNGKYHNI